jgi:hypothetical protein
MTVRELRLNALGLLTLALEAGKNGQIGAAKRLSEKAVEYFDDADLVEAAERGGIAQQAK